MELSAFCFVVFRRWFLTKPDVVLHLMVDQEHSPCHVRPSAALQCLILLCWQVDSFLVSFRVSPVLGLGPCKLDMLGGAFINNGTTNTFTAVYFLNLR